MREERCHDGDKTYFVRGVPLFRRLSVFDVIFPPFFSLWRHAMLTPMQIYPPQPIYKPKVVSLAYTNLY